jgi:1,4-dihydroxy-2-naphthoyl-CoA synthase
MKKFSKFNKGCNFLGQITINRPERRNAFRPLTVGELKRAFDLARDDPQVGVIIFTGKVLANPSYFNQFFFAQFLTCL